MSSFRDLLDRHAVTSWDKQESLFRLMGGEHDWRIDLASGILILTNSKGEHHLPIQWLGTADREENTWIWAWANEQLDVPEPLREAALALRRHGEEHGVSELVDPERDLKEVNGDLMALAASGLCKADGYYLCEMDHGAEYFLFKSDEVRAMGESGPVRCMNVFLSILSHVDLNHRVALVYFLEAKGYDCLEDGPKVTASSAAGKIFATFDELGRITEIRTEVGSTANGATAPVRPEVDR